MSVQLPSIRWCETCKAESPADDTVDLRQSPGLSLTRARATTQSPLSIRQCTSHAWAKHTQLQDTFIETASTLWVKYPGRLPESTENLWERILAVQKASKVESGGMKGLAVKRFIATVTNDPSDVETVKKLLRVYQAIQEEREILNQSESVVVWAYNHPQTSTTQ